MRNMICFVPAILGFITSGLWLTHKLGWLSKIRQQFKQIDNKGIVLASLSVLSFPFLFTYLYNFFLAIFLTKNQPDSFKALLELFRVLIPIGTFMLGRYITLLDKFKDLEQLKESLLHEIYINLENIYVLIHLTRLPGYDPKGFGYFNKLDRNLWSDRVYTNNINMLSKMKINNPELINEIYSFHESLKNSKEFSNGIIHSCLITDLVPKMKVILHNLDKEESELLLSRLDKMEFKSISPYSQQKW